VTADSRLVGAIELPDGSWVRGRGLRRPMPVGPDPTLGIYLGVEYEPPWEFHRIDWPDFRLPRDSRRAADLLRHAHEHSLAGHRLEIACAGGRGRTGTAIAALAILAGVEADQAVSWTRDHYDRHAVETLWQRRWVQHFPRLLESPPATRAG